MSSLSSLLGSLRVIVFGPRVHHTVSQERLSVSSKVRTVVLSRSVTVLRYQRVHLELVVTDSVLFSLAPLADKNDHNDSYENGEGDHSNGKVLLFEVVHLACLAAAPLSYSFFVY